MRRGKGRYVPPSPEHTCHFLNLSKTASFETIWRKVALLEGFSAFNYCHDSAGQVMILCFHKPRLAKHPG